MTIEFDGQNNKLGTTTANSVTIKTNDTDAVTIDSNQNVGVGTTTPTNFGSNFKMLAVEGSDFGVVQSVSNSGSVTTEMMASASVGFIGTRTNHPFVIRTNDTERMRVTDEGLHLGGTGSANALDDYEEGTWTPTYSSGGGDATSVTYDKQNGYYYKIGGVVHVWWTLRTDAINTTGMAGDLLVKGLPFSSGGSTDDGIIAGGDAIVNNFLNDNILTKTGTLDNSSVIIFFPEGSHSGTNYDDVLKNTSNANSMYGHMSYFVDF